MVSCVSKYNVYSNFVFLIFYYLDCLDGKFILGLFRINDVMVVICNFK